LPRQSIPLGTKSGGERGFTLLEIAVTMLIVALLLAIALPRLPRIGRTDLEASADRLAATMSYLSDEASLRGRIYRLTVDLDAEDWKVASLAPFARTDGETPPAAFEEVTGDPLARSVELPGSVTFDAILDEGGETRSGQHPIYFLPEGSTENLGVRLRDEDGGERVTVHLDAAKGIASREDVEAAPR